METKEKLNTPKEDVTAMLALADEELTQVAGGNIDKIIREMEEEAEQNSGN